MIRTLMTTTALAMLLTGGAMAQDASTNASTTAAPATGVAAMDWGYEAQNGDNLANDIIGMQVYSSAANDAEHIGDINNLVVSQDGNIEAVVIGVGGFLGIGEKNVAVSMESIELAAAEDGTERYVLATTKEALGEAPDFVWNDDENTDMAASDGTMATQPAGGATNADQTAAAGTTATDPAMNNNMAADQTAQTGTTTTDPAMDNSMAADQTAQNTTAAPATGDSMAADETATGAVNSTDTNAMAPAGGATMDPLNREGMQEFDESQLTAEELIGTNVYGVNDEHIGAIGDIVLGDDGSIDAVVIDFGGFLGIGTKPVAIAFDNLSFLSDANNSRSLSLPITREQMDQAPAFNRDTYAAERDTQRVMVDGAAAANTQS